MPTYEYECISCRYTFEKFQNINDKPIDRCPRCNKNVRRLISSGAGIIFKGSGFYATDYRKKEHKEQDKPCPSATDACKGCPRKEGP